MRQRRRGSESDAGIWGSRATFGVGVRKLTPTYTLDASLQGWINHVGHADSWGLRRHVLDTLAIRPAEHRRAMAARPARPGADATADPNTPEKKL